MGADWRRPIHLEVVLQSIAGGIVAGAAYGLIGIGFSLTYRTTGVINFAQGDLVALGAYGTYWGIGRGLPLTVAIVLAAVLVGFGMGVAERIALRPLYRYGVVFAIMSTIGLSVALESGIQLVFGPVPLTLPSLVSHDTHPVIGGVYISPDQVVILGVSLAIGAFVIWLLARTRVGRGMRTVAQDREVAELFGISPSRLYFLAFALSGVLAGVAGALIGPSQGLRPNMGLELGIAGFTAAAIGGFGSALGAVTGGILLAVAENLAVLYITPDYENAIAYAILVFLLLFRPQGLFGESGATVRRV